VRPSNIVLTLDLFLWRPVTYRAALLCTFSILSICFLWYGSQTVVAYSSCGLTRDLPVKWNYTLHGHILAHETSSKYLGCTISNNLNWSEHINNTTNKASRSLGFLHRNLHIKSREIKEQAYKSLVRPYMAYCL
jgi:hypothetical protein